MTPAYSSRYFFLLIALIPIFGFANFNPAPSSSAGVVERPIEQEYEAKPIAPERQIPLLEVDLPEDQLHLEDGRITAVVSCIEFLGNTVYSCETLNKLMTPYLNRPLSMREIREICFVIQQKYASDGYFLARAYPPPQSIHNGILLIRVVEGSLGTIQIEGNRIYKTSFIEGYFSQICGRPINYDEFMKALILLNENSDLSAGAVFVKGEEKGTADLIVKVVDRRPIHLYLNSNNYGTKPTTKQRTGGRLDWGNFFTNGDMLSFAAVLGSPVDGLKFFDGTYTVPLGRKGTFLEFGYLWSDFKINQFNFLRLRGKSEIATLYLSHAIHRTRKINTNIYTSFEYKQIQNFQLGSINSFDKLRILSLGFNLDATDDFRGRNIADFRLCTGLPYFLRGYGGVSSKASRPGTGNRLVVFNMSYQRLQAAWKNAFFLLNVLGQASPYKLPLPQQFYIGGIDTVRGYEMATALGDDGYVVNAELRMPLLPFLDGRRNRLTRNNWEEFLQIIFFIDTGGVYLKSGKQENQRDFVGLTGVGTGLRLHGPNRFDFSLDIGFPLTQYRKTQSVMKYFRLTWNPF